MKVKSLGLDRASNTPVVILQEAEGTRVLPIWIGPGEASAIAMQLADMKFSRPLTHDLLVSVLGGMGGDLERAVITRVVENTYYAELIIHRDGEVITVDARPSDSIAVALRMDADIYAHESLLDRASIEVAEDESLTEALGTEEAELEEGEGEDSPGMKADELKEYLRKLNPEDFGRFSP
ncbi:MAG TPA: bifunctional nuclease family protein [Longimicrobiales bacterium]|nr:bifunctional nuclease family protein [Longimicrobiales bacterium]